MTAKRPGSAQSQTLVNRLLYFLVSHLRLHTHAHMEIGRPGPKAIRCKAA